MKETERDSAMKRIVWGLSLGLGIMTLAAQQGAAQGRNCAPREIVLERLAEGYGETRQSVGLGAQGRVMELFASQESGTWTVTVTLPSGITCLIAAGEAYEHLAEAAKDDGA